jgi:anti-anti-sigma factor
VPNPSHILVGQIGTVFWLRIEDKGCFQNSVAVKTAVEQRIASGVRDFVFDLERCPMMDSTFLGTLTGVARDLRESGGGRVTVVNVNTRNEQLLINLGLDHVLEVDLNGSTWVDERKEVASELALCETTAMPCKSEQAAHVLAAHQALCEANAANASRFKDVIDFLERDLDSQVAQ